MVKWREVLKDGWEILGECSIHLLSGDFPLPCLITKGYLPNIVLEGIDGAQCWCFLVLMMLHHVDVQKT